jgi:hypothetical protein
VEWPRSNLNLRGSMTSIPTLLLLGRALAAHFLQPAVAQITWRSKLHRFADGAAGSPFSARSFFWIAYRSASRSLRMRSLLYARKAWSRGVSQTCLWLRMSLRLRATGRGTSVERPRERRSYQECGVQTLSSMDRGRGKAGGVIANGA